MMGPEYRIEYSIQRSVTGGEFEEVGFGSSSAWNSIDAALHDMSSAIQNREWETMNSQPDPEDA